MTDLHSGARLRAEEPVPFIDLVEQYQGMAADVQAAVLRVLSEQKFILGDEVAAFEEEVARYCDARHAIGCASGTDALILSLLALDIGPGDEVVTSPFTFFATASSICRVGAKPVFVDIDPASFNLDVLQVEAVLTKKTKAIMPVHLFGQCAEMDPLLRLAVREKLHIIEDACQAIGAEYHGRRAGVLGHVACFSFFPTKNLGGAGDGGLLTTDDTDLAKRLRRLRVHGDAGVYRHVELGMNSRLDSLQAAILRVKLPYLENWSIARQQNARRYATMLEKHGLIESLELPAALPGRRHVFNQFTVRVKGGRRDEVLASLRKQKIGAGVYYPIPLHLQECFTFLGHKLGDFPEAERASDEVLALPVFPELRAEQQEVVVRGLARALGVAVLDDASETRETLPLRDSRAA